MGSFANIQAGQTLQLQGTWTEHPQYGSQFQVVKYQETKPATLIGIEKYLVGIEFLTADKIARNVGVSSWSK